MLDRTITSFPPLHLRSSMSSASSSSSSWSCPRCTFLNPASQKLSCQICLSPSAIAGDVGGGSFSINGNRASSIGAAASPGQWPCTACTYLNPNGNACCELCGTRAAPFSRFLSDELDPAELSATDPSIGSVFLPLQRCGSKRPAPLETADDSRSLEKLARCEKEEHLGLSSNADTSSDPQMLKILSYNVWFREDLEVYKRMEALGNLILEHLPDFICFQEVTPNIYKIFQSSKWWKAYRCSVSQDMVAERAYFCMQMSKLPAETKFSHKPFSNSIMGRELCLANMKLNSGKTLVIATTHLESPCPAPPKWDQMYSSERVVQAKESLALLKDSQNVIFAGDMNWDDKLDGAFPLPDGWIDAWIVKKPGENGWTYDTKSNKMLSGNRNLQKRLDRFMCKFNDFRIDSVEMIGMEAIAGLFYYKEKKVRNQMVKMELPVLPSDHYGLLLTVSSL
ncbi:uncharacterized protein LOC110031762 [Phalaenopsis equestris]|uniref:uncharacterized protein LOC110031762 n=1 Tax=Phalaenopsis equestris TaxID=78828 RepID=UPI0009E3E13F|nr:uncharacterized protein LOC110031762 [Phalaenopsis equestris]